MSDSVLVFQIYYKFVASREPEVLLLLLTVYEHQGSGYEKFGRDDKCCSGQRDCQDFSDDTADTDNIRTSGGRQQGEALLHTHDSFCQSLRCAAPSSCVHTSHTQVL